MRGAQDFALPVDRVQLAEYYRQVESFQASRARHANARSKLLAAMLTVSLLANLGQGWGISAMLPLTKLVPLPIWLRADGTVDSAESLSRLPATASEAVITAALWQYTRLREGYSYDTAQYGYDVVSGMSSDAVRERYQKWFNYPNPGSPQVTVGQKGQIDIEHIGSAKIAENVMQIRFRRVVAMNGEAPSVTTWTATLQYHIAAALPASKRLTNPGGIIVTAYQSAEDGGQ
jgi:type IV secretion system protein VirB8